ncbi:MAG TPA: histidine phosphatase family protein, partial [Methylomirabilota bacterium]|nr:histidine phosphatase family protein [Methylomirabilota bacterium]
MRIYVARHGLTEMNKLRVANAEIDEPLAPEGIEQAKDAAKSIPKTIRHVYSSPQKRAVQTAKILKPDDSITITEIPDLAEIKMGTLSGIAWQDMPNSQEIDRQRRSVQFDYREHGGEAREDVLERVKRFIESIHDKHND